MGLAETRWLVVFAQASGGTLPERAWCALLSITYDIRWRLQYADTISAHQH